MRLNKFLLILFFPFFFISCEKDNGNGDDDPNLEPIILSGSQSSPLVLESLFNNPARVDYIVQGTWTINAAVTVDRGVRFMMTPGARIDIGSSGSFAAEGTADRPIYIEGEADARGYWDYIRFQSNNPNNIFDHCIISHGGGSSLSNRNGAIALVGNAQLSVSNSVIRESQRNGIIVTSTDNRLPVFENNTITGCEMFPIKIRPQQLSSIDVTTDFDSGNGFNKIEVDGTTVSTALAINKVSGPYLFTGTISLNGATEIEPGTYIEMGPGARIEVRSTGSLAIVGTANDPIVITGEQNAKGYWDFIYYNDTNSPNNIIQHADISYGGGSSLSSRNGMISARANTFLAMGNSSITNSMRYGITIGSGVNWENQGGNVFSGNELGDIND